MNELQEKISALTSESDVRYFYHITPRNGDEILEQGLIVASKFWEESFLEFTSEELANINSVIEDNRPNKIKRSSAIILAGVYADSMNGFIRKLEEDEAFGIEWEGVDTPNFIVDRIYRLRYA